MILSITQGVSQRLTDVLFVTPDRTMMFPVPRFFEIFSARFITLI